MNADWFLDTDILVYAAAAEDSAAWKQQRALELIDTVDFGLSAQVRYSKSST
jgi:predicted nucleic acid-binding protein